MDHSTIIYETRDLVPLLRLSWNKVDPNILATFQMDSSKVVLLDVRYCSKFCLNSDHRSPAYPLAELSGHEGFINALSWAPHSANHLCTVGDDALALIWDVSTAPNIEGITIYFDLTLDHSTNFILFSRIRNSSITMGILPSRLGWNRIWTKSPSFKNLINL